MEFQENFSHCSEMLSKATTVINAKKPSQVKMQQINEVSFRAVEGTVCSSAIPIKPISHLFARHKACPATREESVWLTLKFLRVISGEVLTEKGWLRDSVLSPEEQERVHQQFLQVAVLLTLETGLGEERGPARLTLLATQQLSCRRLWAGRPWEQPVMGNVKIGREVFLQIVKGKTAVSQTQ